MPLVLIQSETNSVYVAHNFSLNTIHIYIYIYIYICLCLCVCVCVFVRAVIAESA
jgi:hypothetical protein